MVEGVDVAVDGAGDLTEQDTLVAVDGATGKALIDDTHVLSAPSPSMTLPAYGGQPTPFLIRPMAARACLGPLKTAMVQSNGADMINPAS